ncbi:MAG: aldo/keto reductase [Planctomycetota bacterium]|jgi:aryl-alcohol dehydrogenase-like predicted oxidoreductase
MKRREFLGKSLASIGGVVLTANLAGAQKQQQTTFFDPCDLVALGKSGLKVSHLCFGTGMKGWMRQSNQTRLGAEEFRSLIRVAYERGIRLFDLADLYGTHHHIAAALKDVPRDTYNLITKIWWRPNGVPEKERPDADVVVARFLKELNTDYIDVLLLHCVDSANWPTELSQYMQTLDSLKKKGLIRARGVSCHSIPALQAAVDEPWVDSVNTRINHYGIKMDGPAEKVAPVLKKLHAAGKGVVGMKILGEGTFANDDKKKDDSIRYVLTLGCVDTLTVGFESPQQIDDFASRVKKVPRHIT